MSKIKNGMAPGGVAPETFKLDKHQLSGLSVVSVKRAPGEREAFAIGNVDSGVWYAEHAYRAITPYGAMRFTGPRAYWDAWTEFTRLTGRSRPSVKRFKVSVRWGATADPYNIERALGTQGRWPANHDGHGFTKEQ